MPACVSAGSSCSFQQGYWRSTKRAQLARYRGRSVCSRRHAVGAGFVVAVFDALHQARHADLDILVEVAGGDGQELDPLEQGIGGVLRLLKNAAVEAQPGLVAAEEQLLSLWLACWHSGSDGIVRLEDVPLIQDTRPTPDESCTKIS